MFTAAQTKALNAPLDNRFVATRSQAGINLSYIEGWHAIAEANRIFGFESWDRCTTLLNCTDTGEFTTKNGKTMQKAAYIAQVRITVHAGDRLIHREGTGSGTGMGMSLGEAHEGAAKEAETDAMKRALMTFGNPFGLALYDKQQASVVDGAKQDKAREMTDGILAQISNATNMDQLVDLTDDKVVARLKVAFPDFYTEVSDAMIIRRTELSLIEQAA